MKKYIIIIATCLELSIIQTSKGQNIDYDLNHQLEQSDDATYICSYFIDKPDSILKKYSVYKKLSSSITHGEELLHIIHIDDVACKMELYKQALCPGCIEDKKYKGLFHEEIDDELLGDEIFVNWVYMCNLSEIKHFENIDVFREDMYSVLHPEKN